MRTVNKEEYEKTINLLITDGMLPESKAIEYKGTLLVEWGKYFLQTEDKKLPFTGNDCYLLCQGDNMLKPQEDIEKRYGIPKNLTFSGVIIDEELYPYGVHVSSEDGDVYHLFSSTEFPIELAQRRNKEIDKQLGDLPAQADESGWQGLPIGSLKKIAKKALKGR
jgi:hypothetical protein